MGRSYVCVDNTATLTTSPTPPAPLLTHTPSAHVRLATQVVAVRIGWVVPEADPRDSKWVETSDHHEYMRCMYLGHDDCEEIFTRACRVPLDAPEVERIGTKDGKFAAIYAVSNNSRGVLDWESTANVLGYAPQQDADTFYQ